jgi:hypothetical protein
MADRLIVQWEPHDNIAQGRQEILRTTEDRDGDFILHVVGVNPKEFITMCDFFPDIIAGLDIRWSSNTPEVAEVHEDPTTRDEVETSLNMEIPEDY